jgi:hypothetical protein
MIECDRGTWRLSYSVGGAVWVRELQTITWTIEQTRAKAELVAEKLREYNPTVHRVWVEVR